MSLQSFTLFLFAVAVVAEEQVCSTSSGACSAQRHSMLQKKKQVSKILSGIKQFGSQSIIVHVTMGAFKSTLLDGLYFSRPDEKIGDRVTYRQARKNWHYLYYCAHEDRWKIDYKTSPAPTDTWCPGGYAKAPKGKDILDPSFLKGWEEWVWPKWETLPEAGVVGFSCGAYNADVSDPKKLCKKVETCKWDDASSLCTNNWSIIGPDGPKPTDLVQGDAGTCYFLSSISSIAHFHPDIIKGMFVDRELWKGDNPVYTTKWLLMGREIKVAVDDAIPVDAHGEPSIGVKYAENFHFWPIVLEKSWAKIYRTYKNIEYAWEFEALKAITQAPVAFYKHSAMSLYQHSDLKSTDDKHCDITLGGFGNTLLHGKYVSHPSKKINGKITYRQEGIYYHYLYYCKSLDQWVVAYKDDHVDPDTWCAGWARAPKGEDILDPSKIKGFEEWVWPEWKTIKEAGITDLSCGSPGAEVADPDDSTGEALSPTTKTTTTDPAKERMWKVLQEVQEKKFPATSSDGKHAWACLGSYTKGDERHVSIYNPHGNEQHYPDIVRISDDKNDGYFDMAFDDYWKFFLYTHVARVEKDYVISSKRIPVGKTMHQFTMETNKPFSVQLEWPSSKMTDATGCDRFTSYVSMKVCLKENDSSCVQGAQNNWFPVMRADMPGSKGMYIVSVKAEFKNQDEPYDDVAWLAKISLNTYASETTSIKDSITLLEPKSSNKRAPDSPQHSFSPRPWSSYLQILVESGMTCKESVERLDELNNADEISKGEGDSMFPQSADSISLSDDDLCGDAAQGKYDIPCREVYGDTWWTFRQMMDHQSR